MKFPYKVELCNVENNLVNFITQTADYKNPKSIREEKLREKDDIVLKKKGSCKHDEE